MKLTFKQRLFFCFFIIFVVFTAIIVVFEQREEKRQKTEALQMILDNYTEIIHKHVERHKPNEGYVYEFDSLLSVFPQRLRVTLIVDDGTVLFDRAVGEPMKLRNLKSHLDRPEIMRALYQSYGTDIRMSETTDQEYFYYARYFDRYFIRVALPYDLQVQSLLHPGRMFIYVALVLLVGGLLLLNYVAGHFAKSISRLKLLTLQIKEGKPINKKYIFPDDELGEISSELTEILAQKEETAKSLRLESEKLIHHFQFSKNGLCIFNADRTKVYSNTHFMQFLNMITGELSIQPDTVFTHASFKDVQCFLDNYRNDKSKNNTTVKINANGKVFDVQVVIFEDDSFEIAIKDITEAEQTRCLKQEMTSNIAHELRTPITSLRGYLETLDTQNIAEDKKQQFIHRAYMQSIRLSTLVEELSMISKMEEASSQFNTENLNVSQLINDVRIGLIDRLQRHDIKLHVDVKDNVSLTGNYTLLYSVFRNLIDNSIDHGGEGVDIFISNYLEDDKYLYFSYYDTGKGVEEKYLGRLFERFYRVSEGRTRDSGGSGLGLSIVKNAVKIHDGDILVKNKEGAGLEFLFTLHK